LYTIHESDVAFKQLPGRLHKMVIGPTDFGRAKNMCFGLAEFPARSQAPAHVHRGEEEIVYVLSGHGEVYLDGSPEPLKPGTCVYIPPQVTHSFGNTADEVMKVLYVFSPPVRQGSYDNPGSDKP